MAEILRVEDLHVHIDTNAGTVKALNGVNIVQQYEEVYCLVGESGAGKSTLALAIMGLLPETATVPAGRVIFDGVDLLRAGDSHLRRIRGRELSLVFQDAQAALNPVQPVGQQLQEVILAHSNISGRTAASMSQEILKELGLPEPSHIMNQYPFALSGGMCQRVMLAIALVMRPKLLIADEATSGLDVTLQAEILERLKNLCQDFGSAVLLITHDMGVVAHMGNQVGVMYAGTVVESAEVLPLFREPRHPLHLGTNPGPAPAGRRQETAGAAAGRSPGHGQPAGAVSLPPPVSQGHQLVPPGAPPADAGSRARSLRRLLQSGDPGALGKSPYLRPLPAKSATISSRAASGSCRPRLMAKSASSRRR